MQSTPSIQELRVALTVADVDQAVQFYRDGLGFAVVKSWATADGRGVILAAGRATLELIDEAQARLIDAVEVGERVSGDVRLALAFPDVDALVQAGAAAGAHLLHAPVVTPWGDRNARLVAPDGMQLTLFQTLDQTEPDTGSPIDQQHLRAAFQAAQQARAHGNDPFGAVLVDPQQQIILAAENTVVTEHDCTGHAETNLMRLASTQFAADVLAGCTVYTSTEPCAMCAAALHWGNIGRLVYGLSAARFNRMVNPSPQELALPCREVFARSTRPIAVLGPLLEDEALLVHEGYWSRPS